MSVRVKTGGRRRGSIDREDRKILTDKMAGDLVWCYQKMGGRDWLLEFAKANPAEFIKSGLSRLWPAPQKSEDEAGGNNTYNQQFNLGSNSFEAARRIAFVLAKGMNADPSLAPPIIDVTPQVETVETPQEACHPAELFRPEPVEDPNKQRWAEELHLTPEERRDRDLIRETREPLENYHGSSAQHGRGPIRSPGSVDRDPRAAQRDRMLARRRKELL